VNFNYGETEEFFEFSLKLQDKLIITILI